MLTDCFFGNNLTWLPCAVMGIDIVAALIIFYYTFKHRYYWIGALEAVQLALILWFESVHGHSLVGSSPFIIDKLAWVMLAIATVIGGSIVVFAIGYMEEFQREHPDVADRRPFFFGVMVVFLLAMFGLVMSNNLLYMYACWEITSLCSFLLIGYTQTAEATANSFKALWMNLLGGLAFAVAIVLMGSQLHTVELTRFLAVGSGNRVVLTCAALLVFCGFTKCAMMPFSGWLLGAMVAPTPTSALLHSSTMVKAGVFLIIQLCPVLSGNSVGLMTLLVGGFTFFFAGCAAVSQSDGKKVLAYSTISNLGLIVCCAGVGSYAGAWTAIMLVIFHAVAKSLCFLSVGTAEQEIGSRNLESFDGMICRIPRLAMCMLIGICGMFLAPFGMLISKWAAMKTVVDAGEPLLVLLLVFGSSITMFYWSKWLGKICTYIPTKEKLGQTIHGVQWSSLWLLAYLVVALCAVFPLLSKFVVSPYLGKIYALPTEVIAENNFVVTGLMLLVLLVMALCYGRGCKQKKVLTQLAGLNNGDNQSYEGALGIVPITLNNWYLEDWFGEKKMCRYGYQFCIVFIVLGLIFVGGGVL
ncbi:MAG: hypothetical protein MJ048_01525 [Acidaminococcaceae bacterium]|nr:hypothetical protein [Acidaminococcaceae bacterium]